MDKCILIPFSFHILRTLQGAENINVTLVFVFLVCAMVGSSTQLAHKNLDHDIGKKEILAVYVSAFMVAFMGYAGQMYSGETLLSAVCTVFASYMSLELFDGLKKAINGIIMRIPNVFWELMYYKYERRRKDDGRKED